MNTIKYVRTLTALPIVTFWDDIFLCFNNFVKNGGVYLLLSLFWAALFTYAIINITTTGILLIMWFNLKIVRNFKIYLSVSL